MNAHIVNDAKEEYVMFLLNGREYPLILDLNLIQAFQSRYGELENVFEKSREIGELVWILTQLLNEAIEIHNDENAEQWEAVNERKVGRMINKNNLPAATTAIMQTFGVSLPQASEEDGDEEKNWMTE